ncbi:hypothetical protein [Cognatilysobacter segetis]|uniref:hypothetical protein n=1 Tax=Cognatilysobacter segetis TaxID=2492394 RepID=UPI00105D1FAA|nr:hypothetical protein [Lysobacter segetis]
MLLAFALPLALAACRGDDRGASKGVPSAVDDAPAGTLPAPEAAPGTSVTGMPTSPPPPREVPADAVATTTPVDAPALPAPVDDTALAGDTPVDNATDAPVPSPAPPPPSAADAAAAANLVTQYMAALGSGALARGQTMWSTTPNDSAVLQLARNAPFDAGVGAPSTDAGGRITVPVDVRGKADDGSDRHVIATYTVQRGPAGNWRIMSAAVRDVAP